MKSFTKLALVAVLSDLAWHVFKLIRSDQEARMRGAFMDRWRASRVRSRVISWKVSGGQTFTIAPGTITFTYSGGGGGGGYSSGSSTAGGGNGNN